MGDFKDTGSLQRGEHPLPSLPVALAPLLSLEHQGLRLGGGVALQFLAPTGLLSIQISPGPACSVSISPSPISPSLCLSFVFLSSPPSLPPSPSLFPSSSSLAGRGRGRWGQLHPPPALGPHSERGSESERGGRERKGEKAGSRRALRVSVRARVRV